jgi:hypothetical protein
MPRRLYIAEEFDSYRRAVIPAQASFVQIEECRRAFFAGAASAINLIGNSPSDSKGQEQFISDLNAELTEFPKRVMKLHRE